MTLKQKFEEIEEAEVKRMDMLSPGKSQNHCSNPYTHGWGNFTASYVEKNYNIIIDQKLNAIAEFLDEKEKKGIK